MAGLLDVGLFDFKAWRRLTPKIQKSGCQCLKKANLQIRLNVLISVKNPIFATDIHPFFISNPAKVMTSNFLNHLGEPAVFPTPHGTAIPAPAYANSYDDEEEEDLIDADSDDDEEDLFGEEGMEGIDEEDLDLEEESDLDGDDNWEDEDEEVVPDDEEEEDV